MPSLFKPEEIEKDIVEVKQKTEQDPDLALKKQMKAEYPKVDGLMLDVILRIHREMITKYGEDYDTDLLEKEISAISIDNVAINTNTA